MNKSQLKLFQQMFAANMPIFEDLIDNICRDYDMEDKVYEIKQRYLYEDKSKITKILNKKKPSGKKRRKTSYTAFLADKSILKNLKEQYPDLKPKQINGKRGALWKSMTVEQKQPYKDIADKLNAESGLVVTPKPTKEVTPKPTKEVTPKATKEATPKATKEATPKTTKAKVAKVAKATKEEQEKKEFRKFMEEKPVKAKKTKKVRKTRVKKTKKFDMDKDKMAVMESTIDLDMLSDSDE